MLVQRLRRWHNINPADGLWIVFAGIGGDVNRYPANMRRLPKAGSMLARRLRRRPNIEPALGKRLAFAG